MKICILTHRLLSNYGGILQNYALQVYLKKNGHNPLTFNYIVTKSLFESIKDIVYGIVYRFLGKRKRFRFSPSKKESSLIYHNTIEFIENYINKTELYKLRDFNERAIIGYDAIIVGSDQVWRPKMVSNIDLFFLSGFRNNSMIKKIAYAASFGVDNWEYSKTQTRKCKELVTLFNAISVREDSGIKLCKDKLKIQAEWVLDPTFLLNKEDYIYLIKKADIKPSGKKLFTYILDNDNNKQSIIESLSSKLGMSTNVVLPFKKYSEVSSKNVDLCTMPPIEQWLMAFYEAEFVVTDSFHGTVFSIIFEKPFIVICNEARGKSRFESLLRLFNLQDRIIFKAGEEKNIQSYIDYDKVRIIKEQYKLKSKHFLEEALKNS